MELPVLVSSHELGYCYCAGTMGGSGHPQRTCTQANLPSNGHQEQLVTRKECASGGFWAEAQQPHNHYPAGGAGIVCICEAAEGPSECLCPRSDGSGRCGSHLRDFPETRPHPKMLPVAPQGPVHCWSTRSLSIHLLPSSQ